MTISDFIDLEKRESEIELAREFKDFAYIISHDFNSPLRAISTYTALLQEEHAPKLNDEAQAYLDHIMDNTLVMQHMLQGILSYSRLNTMAKTPSMVDSSIIAQQCLLLLQQKIHQRHANVALDQLPIVYADTDQLLQVFLALLDNAIKFSPKNRKPEIQFRAQEMRDTWHFILSDNGDGIPEDQREAVFKIFHRLNNEPEGEMKSTGMGLALAKKIILRHRGLIWLDTSEQGGLAVHFTLPRMPTKA